jgi:tRNA1Val (adenine37-N6)-methyltransferase
LLTRDSLFNGKLVIYQQARGYRFSLDAVLLAGLTRLGPAVRGIDLGTGCGVVPLLLAHRWREQAWVGVDIQAELVELARRSAVENGLAHRVTLLELDLRSVAEHFLPASFDWVLSNPPYRRLNSGRLNPDPRKALARHEVSASVADVFVAGRHLLADGGRLAVIYPASRLAHLFRAALTHDFAPVRMTTVHSRGHSPAYLVHLECRKGGGEELRVEPPFIIYEESGDYTEDMAALAAG